ncbi:hypothetical protein [Arthrobacter sp. B3I4]|uniref:hypothetical protein n=1 Tax=Arthrobacter sp. B3I4 TaxID=3042267 RepID=UPI002789CF23|nr:hypothetical protein [Arthrobacter sp. B3I4]MDQ0757310.1 hypothetical protein [Arthrobacter sp. B3I4]
MSERNRAATVARHLEQSRENNEYATPYDLVCSNLRTQNVKARAAAVELLMREFDLQAFDAETVARSAADLSQLKEAARSAQTRRYGQYEITFVEVDVVTWRIVPSLENIRFEGDRAWKSGQALRYETPLSSQPVLGLSNQDPDFVVRSLRSQTKGIWDKNPHSRSIPMRGIETPGLLSITRLALGDNDTIGILDATDGFSRTVGAQRGSGIDIDEVLFDLQRDATENKLRHELIDLRDSGEADVESETGEIAAARLRSSVMPRAQIIVGYRKIGLRPGENQPPFAEVRRSLVGHIHLEPPLPFLDSTENALKARIALEAVHTADMMPPVDGLSAEEVFKVLQSENGKDESGSPGAVSLSGLHPDEVLLLASEALISPLDPKRARVVNTAVHSLTGKKPLKSERAALAADTAMRVNRIALGQGLDSGFKGRRSTVQRVLATPTLKNALLTRRPILDIRDAAIQKIREQRAIFEDNGREVSADAAELGALGLYCLVEGVMSLKDGEGGALLIRSNTRVNGEYMPEPQQIIQKMVASENGIQQLAQIVVDVRGDRAPRRLLDGEAAGSASAADRALLTTDDLYRYKNENWSPRIDPSSDPYVARDLYRRKLVEEAAALKEITDRLKSIELPSGESLIEKEGLTLENKEWETLDAVSLDLKFWNRHAERIAPTVAPIYEEEDDDVYAGRASIDEDEVLRA